MRKVGLLVLLLVLSAGSASADPTYSATYLGINFSLTTSGNTATLTVDPSGCNYTSGTNTCSAIGDVAFKWLSSYTSITSSSVIPTGSYASAGTGGLNANGCNGAGSGFVCFNINFPGWTIGSGTLTFNVTVAGGSPLSPTDDPSVKAQVWAGQPVTTCTGNPNHPTCTTEYPSQTLISNPLPLKPPPPPPVPEPATMTLLGTGLLGAGTILRRKFGR